MKTRVVFCCLLASIVLCIGTHSEAVPIEDVSIEDVSIEYFPNPIILSDQLKSSILQAHNDVRGSVSPTAAGMIKLVSQSIHIHLPTRITKVES